MHLEQVSLGGRLLRQETLKRDVWIIGFITRDEGMIGAAVDDFSMMEKMHLARQVGDFMQYVRRQ